MFDSIHIATTGVSVHRKWLDAVSDNIANINNVSPTNGDAFQERFVRASAVEGGGVTVTGIENGDPAGRLVYDPNHPLADEQGNVKVPDMDLADQMGYLIMAQRGYQANVAAAERASNSYQAALNLGKNV
ncbi:flagellar basal body rod C-terminal domain-containing protein [Actinophytocola sp.]|uniref:flagellar basal body rod protein FlgC n=1 Tax=Actinophytocola sp. TaxID=1872138 RepID=UPI002D7F5C60|nr:flagellar basal body rod C-terminal domain-containing protein [Actinophytocola sp.]HET9143753.1 flagellar basal body rod C-terminal domain-containing protein [Actinophytocola sp.]